QSQSSGRPGSLLRLWLWLWLWLLPSPRPRHTYRGGNVHPLSRTIGDMDVDDEVTWTYLHRVRERGCTLPPPAKPTAATLGRWPSPAPSGLKPLPQGAG